MSDPQPAELGYSGVPVGYMACVLAVLSVLSLTDPLLGPYQVRSELLSLYSFLK